MNVYIKENIYSHRFCTCDYFCILRMRFTYEKINADASQGQDTLFRMTRTGPCIILLDCLFVYGGKPEATNLLMTHANERITVADVSNVFGTGFLIVRSDPNGHM